MRNLDLRDYMRVLLPKPPREEQERIAVALSSADLASVRLEQLLAAIDRLRRAVLQQLFSRGLPGQHQDFTETQIGVIPSGWDVMRLKSLIARIEAGASPLCEGHPARAGRWGVLKVSAVSWDAFDERENKELPSTIEPDLRAEVRAGDLIVSRANTTGLCGAAQIVRHLNSKLLLCDKTWRVVPAPGIEPEWLVLLLKSQATRRQIAAIATGTSDSMKNVSQRDFRRMWVALPPEGERRTAVGICRALDVYRDSVIAQALRLNSVGRSLLQNLTVGRVRLAEVVPA